MEERLIPLPSEKNTFQNTYISPGQIRKFETQKKLENPETEKLKAKIFTRELEDLIQKVASKKKILNNPITFQLIPEGFSDKFSLYHKIYDRQNDRSFVSESILNLVQNFGISKYILFGLNSQTGFLSPLLFSGWKDPTRISLILLHPKNPLFSHEIKENIETSVKNCLENDFFNKYFLNESFGDTTKLLPLGFEVSNRKLLLFLFSNKTPNSSEILNTLKPINPIVLRLLEESEKQNISLSDIPLEIYTSIKNEYANNKYNDIYIHKIIIENFFNTYDRERRKSELIISLENSLGNDYKIFEFNHNTFIILSPENKTEPLNKTLVNKLGGNHEFQFFLYKYPTNNNNFYLIL